jgi:hypothetical protein
MATSAVGPCTCGGTRGLGHCHRGVSGVQGAGGRGTMPPGSPPRWAPVGPSAVVSTAHEPGQVGCLLWGDGAAFWCPKWPVPLSRLFGGGLESHRNPLKSVGTASGWCGVGHRHVPAKCARGYPRKRPGSTPNPKSGSEIAIDTRRTRPTRRRTLMPRLLEYSITVSSSGGGLCRYMVHAKNAVLQELVASTLKGYEIPIWCHGGHGDWAQGIQG